MAATADRQIEHLLRRAGFGARPDELAAYGPLSIGQAVDALIGYDSSPDAVDSFIGTPGYINMTISGAFQPQGNINHARQRWLFRLVHTERPLQEKMTLFWHNHFATGYTKVAGAVGAAEAARYLAAKSSEDPGHVRGQIEMLRDNALGRFSDILAGDRQRHGDARMARRPDQHARRSLKKTSAAKSWSCSRSASATTRRPTCTPRRACSAAGTFSAPAPMAPTIAALRSSPTSPNQHDTAAKTFSFAIYPDGGKTIPARSAADGMQDGIDFINGLAAHPNTARYLATKLYRFFVNEFGGVNVTFVNRVASVYLRSSGDMKAVMREVLLSPEFWDESAYFARYSWPVEYVIRALKDVGWTGFSVNDALTPLSNMGQILFEPPDVSGWDAGQTWFSTGAMLARMNFASTLAGNQKFNLASAAKAASASKTPGGAARVLPRCAAGSAARLERDRRAVELSARHRRLDRHRRAIAGEGRRARAPDRRIAGVPARMKVTRRQFVKGGVAAFTVTFAAPEFLSDLARAQGAHAPQPRRALPERRQRFAQHARAVQRSVLHEPAADAGDSGRPGAADRHRRVEAWRSDCTRG